MRHFVLKLVITVADVYDLILANAAKDIRVKIVLNHYARKDAKTVESVFPRTSVHVLGDTEGVPAKNQYASHNARIKASVYFRLCVDVDVGIMVRCVRNINAGKGAKMVGNVLGQINALVPLGSLENGVREVIARQLV